MHYYSLQRLIIIGDNLFSGNWLSIAVVSVVLITIIILLWYINKRKINSILLEKNRQLEITNHILKQSESKLRKLNATKDKFFSIISHDLKNPFNAIIGFSEVLCNHVHERNIKDIIKYSEFINKNARHVYLLFENLLEWSRAQTDRIKLTMEKFDLHSAVLNVFALIDIHAYNKNVDLTSTIPKKTFVVADKNLISTVLRNIITNAVKFTQNGGEVTVSAKRRGNMMVVSVSDTGIGIDKLDIDKLFKIDENQLSIGNSVEKGTGLGLILCKEFVEIHGGKIWAVSKPNKGSIFRFTVPAYLESI